VPTYIGLVNFKESGKTGNAELDVGKAARALTEAHGGRILSI